MIIKKVETYVLERNECAFDKKRQGRSVMPWDVVVIRLTTDTDIEGVSMAMAARSAKITKTYIDDIIAPVIIGRDPNDTEAIWHELWEIDRHLAFFPVDMIGPIDVALYDIRAKAAGVPLYKYLGAYRTSLPVYASGLFHETVGAYTEEAIKYKNMGITAYKAHPPSPPSMDMKVHSALREAVGEDYTLMTDPCGTYTLEDAVRVGRQLEKLNYHWFEEPFRDFEINKYKKLCDSLDIPIANTETTRGCHWGVAQSIVSGATDIVRADVSWKAGITGTLKVAHLAESHGLMCELHTTTITYMDIVNLHVSCAVKNCEYFEYFVPEDFFAFPLVDYRLPIDESGHIHVPTGDGIGVEVDFEYIKKECSDYFCLEV